MINLPLVGALLISLATAHSLLLIPGVRAHWRFWTYVEYAWLGTATIGLLLAVAEVRRIHIQAEIDQANFELHAAYASALESARWADDFVHWVPKPGPEAAWFTRVRQAVEAGIEHPEWRSLLTLNRVLVEGAPVPGTSAVPKFPDWQQRTLQSSNAFYRDLATKVVNSLIALDHAHNSAHRLSVVRPSPLEVALRTIAPFLISLALGFRIARTSNDFLRQRDAEAETRKAESRSNASSSIDDGPEQPEESQAPSRTEGSQGIPSSPAIIVGGDKGGPGPSR